MVAADPRPISMIFYEEEAVKEKLYLMRIVTVVDCRRIHINLDEPKQAGVLNEAHSQLILADIVLLNKVH